MMETTNSHTKSTETDNGTPKLDEKHGPNTKSSLESNDKKADNAQHSSNSSAVSRKICFMLYIYCAKLFSDIFTVN